MLTFSHLLQKHPTSVT